LHLERTGRFIVDADVPALRQQILLLGFPELDADFVATTTELLKLKFGLRVLIIKFKEASKEMFTLSKIAQASAFLRKQNVFFFIFKMHLA
jgi:hypothetical protein